ncbi:transposase [Streptomyces sp. NBC_01571]|uniref:transposase n=1 Tax=Streptomyces sp. NBC_01571 TaxID=2975883 RepID=UPI00225AA2A9|nr:transposase [Streptomyces sp. NBC_01571]MCX4580312.1 transposase [Streptomyces sp. NBC_01571]
MSLHLACDDASAAVDWRLFLPESWDPASPKADPARIARRTPAASPPTSATWRSSSWPWT